MDKRRTLTIYKRYLALWKKLEKDLRMHRVQVNSSDSFPCPEVFHLVAKERRQY
jgi:hypothetical protein